MLSHKDSPKLVNQALSSKREVPSSVCPQILQKYFSRLRSNAYAWYIFYHWDPGNHPHLTTKNISTFFFLLLLLWFASFVNTEYMALLNFDFFIWAGFLTFHSTLFCTVCSEALGMQSGAINNSQIKASSYKSSWTRPSEGRLHNQL